jgi:predicted dehydrogenase
MLQPLRIGIVGTGFGAAVHLPALLSLPGVTVAAIAGARADKTAEIARKSGIARACRGIEELLAQDLDAVTLALPASLAETAASLALDRGLAILAEKPLASSAEGAEMLARRAAGRTAVVDFEFAELPGFHALRGLIASGELGHIERIDVDWMTQSYAHRHRIWSWKTDRTRKGGVAALLGTHALFLLEWLVGPVVFAGAQEDSAATRLFAPSGGVSAADSVMWRGRTAAGASVIVELCNSGRGSPRHRWEIVGKAGRAVLANSTSDTVAGFQLSVAPAGKPARALPSDPIAPGDSRLPPFRALAERFIGAVRAGTACQPDFTAGARVQRLIADIEALTQVGQATAREAV